MRLGLGLGGEGHRHKIVLWNDARGFGFITPLSKGPNIFVHISQFQHRNRRPCLNDRLTYVIGADERGRARAMDVRVLNGTQLRAARKKRFPAVFPVVGAVLLFLGLSFIHSQINSVGPSQPLTSSSSAADREILSAFQARQSGVQVGGEGVVDRILSDDNDGSRHQRFILRLASGHTLLIAHNIDIAPRIEALESGDRVAFFGQYEWNAQGGVVHWTHHDPDGQHASGWLKASGRLYQ